MPNLTYTFNPGVSANIYLPLDEAYSYYTAFFTGLPHEEFNPCLDKYGLDWRWNTLSVGNIENLSSSQTVYPSSWDTLKHTPLGTYPKKWSKEGLSAFSLFKPNLSSFFVTPITWTLSSKNWDTQNVISIEPSTSQNFSYGLKFKDYGSEYSTADLLDDTYFTLNAKITAQVYDTTIDPATAENIAINENFNFVSIAPPRILIDTPKQFIPINTQVVVTNSTTKTNLISALIVNLGNGTILNLSGSDVSNDFVVSYNNIGTKTISVTAFSTKWASPFIMDFYNIIQTYSYYPGPNSNKIYLPSSRNSGTPGYYTSTFFSTISNNIRYPLCYGKYGINWKWDTFKSENIPNLAETSTNSIYPSSWNTLAHNTLAQSYKNSWDLTDSEWDNTNCSEWDSLSCSTVSKFVKSWELLNDSDLTPYKKSSIWKNLNYSDWDDLKVGDWDDLKCFSLKKWKNFNEFGSKVNLISATPLTWTLSSKNWSTTFDSTKLNPAIYDYGLRLFDAGKEKFNVSYFEDTDLTLNATLTVTHLDVSTYPEQYKTSVVSEIFDFTTIAPPALSVVPSTHLIEKLPSVSSVFFKNYTTHTEFITSLKISFDDVVTELTGTQVSQDFVLNFQKIGTKNISLTAFTPYWDPIIANFLRVVKIYSFDPGITLDVYLPPEGEPEEFIAYYRGFKQTPFCFDKYGAIWSWNNFICENGLCVVETPYPFSWDTVGSSLTAAYPKKWKKEGPINYELFGAGYDPNSPSEETLSDCFGKYGIVWNWNTFTSTNVKKLGLTQTVYPSSWNTMGSPLSATYPKKWKKEPALYFDLFSPDFNPFKVTSINWTLSTLKWPFYNTAVIHPSVSEDFFYNLRINNEGEEYSTVSYWDNTDLTLNSYLSVTYIDTSVIPFKYTTYPIGEGLNFVTWAPPDIKIYTPNKYVLTGVNVNFENLISKTHLITGLGIGFDDGLTLFLTGDSVNDNFSISYDILGSKTISVSAHTGRWPYPIVTVFPNIIKVLSEYEVVEPLEYRSISTPIQLPWTKQPTVGSNDWIVSDNINICFDQFHENLKYLDTLGKLYRNSYKEYCGYLGPNPENTEQDTIFAPLWTWADADCFNTPLDYSVTWKSLLTADNVLDTGELSAYGRWIDQYRSTGNNFKSAVWKDGGSWDDESLWTDSPEEIDSLSAEDVCGDINWNVNIPKINEYYDLYKNVRNREKCVYQGITSFDNDLFTVTKTEIRYIPDSKDTDFYDSRSKFDDVLNFSDIKNVCRDSEGKIFVLDGILSQVAIYKYIPGAIGDTWYLLTNWGGYGTENSKNKYLDPNDIHVDKYDTLWVVDTGNQCVKHYSNTGTWLLVTIKTINKPLSLCVDSQDNVHILTDNNIEVYSYKGEFLFTYEYSSYTSSTEVRRIVSSYNKEIVYIVFENSILKFFRNGVFCGTIISVEDDIDNITSVFHDEFRNLLVTTNNRILKYVDLMERVKIKGPIPEEFWNLEDLYIHKNEYIQNWVYTKAFQRLWDNIEFFRNTLYYSDENNTNSTCKKYKAPIYGKDKMIVGQNEIVTSTVINRVLGYLWENFLTIVDFFDPTCSK